MVYNQLLVFFVYVVSGIIICIIFDFFRSLRKSIKTPNVITYIEDALFWVIVGVLLIIIINKYSYGELRLYIPAGIIIGSIIYYLTLSKLLIKLNINVIKFFKLIINQILKFIGKPIYFLLINLRKRKSKKIVKKQK